MFITALIPPNGPRQYYARGLGRWGETPGEAFRFNNREAAEKAGRDTIHGDPAAFWNCERRHNELTRAQHRGWRFEVERLPDIRVVASPMGGGWALPETDTGRLIGAEIMGEKAEPIAPLGGVDGWILEPADSVDLLNAMISEGCAVETVYGRVIEEPVESVR